MKKSILLGLVVVIAVLGSSVYLKAEKPIEAGEVAYWTSWQWGKAEPVESGGWQVTNDLGYTIHVQTAYVVNFSVQLIPCEYETTGAFDLLKPRTAYAGHGSQAPEPSKLEKPQVESFARLGLFEFGTISVPYHVYCQAHYLIGQAKPWTENLPDDVDMLGKSLYIAGTYTAPESNTAVPFIIETSLANGKLVELHERGHSELVEAEIGQAPLTITVERDAGTLFDGVDFATMDGDEQARTVLWTLIARLDILVTIGDSA